LLAPLVAVATLLVLQSSTAHGPDERCRGQEATEVGTPEPDFMLGTPGRDVMVGGAGPDAIVGMDGDDILCGGPGDDELNGDSGADELSGGADSDVINDGPDEDVGVGGSGPDSFSAGPGDDDLSGGTDIDLVTYSAGVVQIGPPPVHVNLAKGFAETKEGRDSLAGFEAVEGSNGSDTIVGDGQPNLLYGDASGAQAPGDDHLEGGGGFDVVDFSSSGSPVTVRLGQDSASGQGDDSLAEVEGILGSPMDDHLVGDTDENQLFGGEGTDTLSGGRGEDILSGGDGDDSVDGGMERDMLEGGAGEDELLGGPDRDTAGFSQSASPIDADLSSGAATGDGSDAITGIEHLIGSPADDVLTGNSRRNGIDGGSGADEIRGLEDGDSLAGGAGDDIVKGGAGNDSVRGDGGENDLDGGPGKDSCFSEPDASRCETGFGDSPDELPSLRPGAGAPPPESTPETAFAPRRATFPGVVWTPGTATCSGSTLRMYAPSYIQRASSVGSWERVWWRSIIFKWVPNVGWRRNNTGAWISGTAYNYNDWTWISSAPDFRWTISTKGYYLVQGEVYWNVLGTSRVYNVGHTTYRNGWWEDGSWCQF